MKFVLLGSPVAQSRPRLFVKGKDTHVYDADHEKKSCAKFNLLCQMKQQKKDNEISCKLPYFSVVLIFYMKIPKSYSKKKYELAINNEIRPINCDLDNLIKFILDAGNEILWRDDRYIIQLQASKKYSDNPRTEIFMENSQ